VRPKTLTMLGTLLAVSAIAWAQKSQTFAGEITDTGCAGMGSHAGMGKPPKECVAACVKAGAEFVLFDAAAQKTYQLDDQKKPAQFAAEKVIVTGTLDAKTRTIHVTAIKAAP
jgi:hypothetical protein